jgi:hypothetical protein
MADETPSTATTTTIFIDPDTGRARKELQEESRKKKPYGFIAFDIETTGADVFTDKMFAVGWAYGSCKEDVVTGKCILDLKKPKDKSWSFFWFQKQWESRCWNEFWSENEPTLDALQDERAVKAQPRSRWCNCDNAMAFWVASALQEAEETFEKYTVITDTIAFDTVWLTNLLCSCKLPGLNYKRDGTFNRGIGGIEVDSYLMGIFGLKLNCRDARNGLKIRKPWEKDLDYAKAMEGAPPHDHDPENDAHNILYQFFCAADAAGRFEYLIGNFIADREFEKEVEEKTKKSREAYSMAKRILDSSSEVADRVHRVLERGADRKEGRCGRGGEWSPSRRLERRKRKEEEEEEKRTEESPPKKMKTCADGDGGSPEKTGEI